jgi:[acyl-carrier-protein] S-malonyltransferase
MSNKFAFLFTGQGAQAIGMLNGFAGNAIVEQTVAEASDALGQDLGKLIAEGPKEALDLTTNTQPVMLTAAVAVYRAWIAAGGPVPHVVAGHRANTRPWWPPAPSPSRTRCRWCVSARKRCRTRCR